MRVIDSLAAVKTCQSNMQYAISKVKNQTHVNVSSKSHEVIIAQLLSGGKYPRF